MVQYTDSGQMIPNPPAYYPIIDFPAVKLEQVAPLFENLPIPQFSKEIQPMEDFDQGWGTILYRTSLPEVTEGTTLV